MVEEKKDLKRELDEITKNPDIDDYFIIVTTESEFYFDGKTCGPAIIEALAKAIVERAAGLATINRMQLAIFKAKELAKKRFEKSGILH
jgi:hypothetical protein